jgi:hypothetical protein
MPQLLYPQGKGTWYPLDRRLGGPQSQSGCSGEEKNSQPLPRLKPPIIQSTAQHYTTELSWLLSRTSILLVSFHLFSKCKLPFCYIAKPTELLPTNLQKTFCCCLKYSVFKAGMWCSHLLLGNRHFTSIYYCNTRLVEMLYVRPEVK